MNHIHFMLWNEYLYSLIGQMKALMHLHINLILLQCPYLVHSVLPILLLLIRDWFLVSEIYQIWSFFHSFQIYLSINWFLLLVLINKVILILSFRLVFDPIISIIYQKIFSLYLLLSLQLIHLSLMDLNHNIVFLTMMVLEGYVQIQSINILLVDSNHVLLYSNTFYHQY